jgi:hypothetical protein
MKYLLLLLLCSCGSERNRDYIVFNVEGAGSGLLVIGVDGVFRAFAVEGTSQDIEKSILINFPEYRVKRKRDEVLIEGLDGFALSFVPSIEVFVENPL